MTVLRILRFAFLTGATEYAAIYTVKTWLVGWYLRVLAQVAFFALIGRLIGSDDRVYFLLVGNAIMLAAMEGLWALNMTLWERNLGTLPLLTASPTPPPLVFVGRGAYVIADGTVSALGALLVAGPLFGLPLPWPRVLLVVPLTVLVAASAYCLGTFLGALVLRFRAAANVVVNVGILALMMLCGVNVALDAYPPVVAAFAHVLPLTNGLLAIRGVLGGDGALVILGRAAAEAGVGAAWLGVCFATFGRLVGRGRRDGTIEFAS